MASPAVGRVDAARRAATVFAGVEQRPVVALLGRRLHAVAATARQPASLRTVGIIRASSARTPRRRPPAPRRRRSAGPACSRGCRSRRWRRSRRRRTSRQAVHDAVATAPAPLAARHAAAVRDLGIAGVLVVRAVVTLLEVDLQDAVAAAGRQLAARGAAVGRAVVVVVLAVVALLAVGASRRRRRRAPTCTRGCSRCSWGRRWGPRRSPAPAPCRRRNRTPRRRP